MKFKINFPSGSQVENERNDNIDINIILENGEVYFTTFFTLSNIEKLLNRESDKYFWAADMIIVNDLRINSIIQIIKNMISDGTLESNFPNIGNEEDIYGNPPRYNELVIVD